MAGVCVVAWGCPVTADRTEPDRVGVAASTPGSGRNLMVASGDGLALIASGEIPQRGLVDARAVLGGRAWPEVEVCGEALCVDAWVDRSRGVGAVRLRSGAAPAPAPEHVTVLWAHSAREASVKDALRDAIRDAPAQTRFSLVHATRPPRVLARSGADAGSKASLVAALDAGFATTFVDAHVGMKEAFTEAARSGAEAARVVAVLGPGAWPAAPKPWHTEELVRLEREVGVEVGAFGVGARAAASQIRDLARAGGGARGQVRGRDDAWARAAVGGRRVDVGEVSVTLDAADLGRVWGGDVARSEGAARVALGRVSGTAEGLEDAVVVFRLGGGTQEVRVRVGEEVVVAGEAELDDAGDAAVTLEAIEAALADFEAGGPRRARDRIARARAAVARGGRDASTLRDLEDALDEFVGD
jgi:hypothetical protein